MNVDRFGSKKRPCCSQFCYVHPGVKLVVFITHIFLNGRDKSRQTNILKKSTTTLSMQNMFRLINDHRQLQVSNDEFEFQLKLQCELTLLQCGEKFKLPGNVTTRLRVNKARANTFFSGKHFIQEKLHMHVRTKYLGYGRSDTSFWHRSVATCNVSRDFDQDIT